MEKDTEITKVIFVKNMVTDGNRVFDEIVAVFPYQVESLSPEFMLCYSHIGQHSGCGENWVSLCDRATKEEYKELFDELLSIGYNLKVLKSFPYKNSYFYRLNEIRSLKALD